MWPPLWPTWRNVIRPPALFSFFFWQAGCVLLYQLIVIALVQGITEFLPISSSAHLILVPVVTGWPDQGLTIDVAVHVGTLVAVLLYFRRDVAMLAAELFKTILHPRRGAPSDQRRLLFGLVIATIPTVLAGLAIKLAGVDVLLRNITIIGWASLGFGLVLYWADQQGADDRPLGDMTLRRALAVGLAQAVALIPGSSRAGMTILAARFLGFHRVDAARFSMLLSIPTILAAGTLSTLELIQAGNTALGLDALIAAVLAFMSAYVAIGFLLRWLQRATFTPFVVYRVLLGVVLLAAGYGIPL